MYKNYLLFLGFLLIGLTSKAFGIEPDIFIFFEECSTTIASTEQAEAPLKIVSEGNIPLFSCARKEKEYICKLVFKNSKEKSHTGEDYHKFKIEFEGGTKLFLQARNWGDFISINRSTHSATIITRLLDDSYAAAKVCRGIFLTGDEMKASQKKGAAHK